ncbi:cation acetate symporter [Coriobacteriia bacterium Es71-Z0120]|uniref:solute symporter family protein n=1 Tax=Parvivirga hydrogeniphila TaxID=2939460 RepID=UPI002260E4FD|nr:cation acetate symporter [Parvivirga hydrogeniphila]MCL4078349.1 cation acetate symporter [Parvivirga hydrogeniphila]
MNTLAIVLVVVLILFTIALSIFSRRFTRTTADFYLAGRKVGSFSNASAISGDYLSAASFLGVAGAVYASGLDGVWYAAGFAGGFMVVVLFIASALRRFGEYTVADFAYGRFGSDRIRLITVLAVLLTSLFYMAPQMFGAGTTWQVLVGKGILGMDPYTSGVVVVAAIMALYVGLGGMKGTTLNQIFQFWWLFFAMFMVVAFAFGHGFSYPKALADASKEPIVDTKALTVAELTTPNPATGKTPLEAAKTVMTPEEYAKVEEFVASKKEGKIPVALPSKNKLHELRAMLFREPGHRYNAFDQFSMVLALVLGTAGLPHILNRYYTNPSGSAARRSTFWVLVFIGLFYIMAPIAGLAGLGYIKEHLANGGTIAAANVHGHLVKPDQVMPTLANLLGGQALLGVVSAGAFAAMFSTIGGLLIASASAVGHDVYEKYINPNASEAKRVLVGRIAVLVFSGLALTIGLAIPKFGLDQAYPALIAMMVTWAFSVGASAFVPMLLTGIWWKGTTERGATAGIFVGLGSSIAFIFLNILQTLGKIPKEGAIGFLGSLTFPVLFTFPLALLTIIVVSKLDGQLPKNVDEIWMRIHGTAHERHERDLGLDKVGGLLGTKSH